MLVAAGSLLAYYVTHLNRRDQLDFPAGAPPFFSIFCGRCGEFIDKGYTTAFGRHFHLGCFVCDQCKVFSGQRLFRHQSGFLCAKHLCSAKKAACKCAVCGQSIQRKWFSLVKKTQFLVAVTGEVYCAHHAQEPEYELTCFLCHRHLNFKSAQPFQVFDPSASSRRFLCNSCAQQGRIFTLDALEPLHRFIQSQFRYLGLNCPVDLLAPLVLVDEAYLGAQQPAQEDFQHVEGLTHKMTSFAVRRTKIYVLAGLPKVEMISVLAHEMMHSYLHTFGVLNLPKHVEESLCELMSYLALSGLLLEEPRKLLNLELSAVEETLSLLDLQLQERGSPLNSAYKSIRGRGFIELLHFVSEHKCLPPPIANPSPPGIIEPLLS